MNGKEQFKEVRNSYLDGIMSEYSVGKEAAYTILATALENPCVLDTISKAIADGFVEKKAETETEVAVSPFEEWANQFLTRANKLY